MSSTDLKGDAIGFFADNQRSILAVVGAAIVLLLLLTLFGGLRVLGSIFFVGYGVVWLTVIGVVIWLFYRLVVAAERIATAQERMANARTADEAAPTTAEPDDDTATDG
jgi:hypothetical protein